MLEHALALHTDNWLGAALAGVPMLVNLAVLVYTLRRLPRDHLTAVFVLWLVSTMSWQAFDLMVRLSETAAAAEFWRGYLRLGQVYSPFLGMHFVVLYAELDHVGNAWWFRTLLYAPPTIHIGGYLAGHWREELVYHEGWGWLADATQLGVAYHAFLVYGSLVALATLGLLIWNTWRVRHDPVRMSASMTLTIGLVVSVLAGVTFEAILPLLGRHQLPITSTFAFAFGVATVLGLTRYQLFRVSTPEAAKAVLETLTEPLLIVLDSGKLLYVNDLAANQFGLDRERTQTVHIRSIFPAPGDADAFLDGPWQRALRGERVASVAADLLMRDVSVRPHLLSVAPVPITRQGAPGVAVIAHDVSELKAIERDLVEARDQAQFANRAKSEFLANMSHELRTPLNAIIGYAELLEEEADEDATRDDLQRIRRSGRYLLDLINDVLDLSKVESGKFELEPRDVDLHSTLDALRPTFEQLMRRNDNQLVFELPEDRVVVVADPTRLRQILLNLVSNAAKFTDSGTVTVAVEADGPGRVNVDITDTGLGIAPDKVDLLFGVFTQVHQIDREKYGGTGLGLALSKRLCMLMGGDVRVLQSTPGAGTTFRVELPTPAGSGG